MKKHIIRYIDETSAEIYRLKSGKLLFIESLPAPETRDYVQKVMTNLWIYRDRLFQSPDSHRILAAESWPHYRAQDLQIELLPISAR